MEYEYPKEFLIEFDGQNYLEGRLTVTMVGELFNVDVDIILKESKKIYRHINILYNQSSLQEALDNGVQSLSFYLKNLSKK